MANPRRRFTEAPLHLSLAYPVEQCDQAQQALTDNATMTKRKRVVRHRPTGPSIVTKRRPETDGRVARWICATLFVMAVLPYFQTLGYEFVNFDDGTYVAENPVVQQGLTWSSIAWAWTSLWAGNWHPLTWLSHMLDCQIFGLRPGWHHLVNGLLHALNAVLVFLVFRDLSKATWRSALVAALFALHPLHVESVAWIAERKDVLSTAFGLSAIWAYAKYTRAPSWTAYGIAAGLFALSLLSKPMWVTFPFLLFLLDAWPLGRFLSETRESHSRTRSRASLKNPKLSLLVLEKVPLLAMSVASSFITFRAQHAGGAVAPIDVLPLSQRLTNAIIAYSNYLKKAFWPIDLAVIYPLPQQTSVGEITIAFLVLAGITIGVTMLMRRRPWLAVGWLWFLGMLIPVIGLVQVGNQSMADRYTYMPLIGVFIMIAWSVPTMDVTATNRGRFVATTLVAASVLTALATITFLQIQTWKTTMTLFTHAVTVTQGNFMAHNLLAGAFGQQGDLNGAREQIGKALQIRPNYSGARYNLGMVMLQQGDFAQARDQFNVALQSDRQNPMIWNGLGVANLNLGRLDEAISSCQRALELNPNYPDAFANLGATFLAEGKFAEAIEMSQSALKLRPGIADAHATLGMALLKQGRADESILHNRMALQLNPALPDPRVNLGAGLVIKGDYDEAISQLEQVLRSDPQHELARQLLNTAQEKRSLQATQP